MGNLHVRASKVLKLKYFSFVIWEKDILKYSAKERIRKAVGRSQVSETMPGFQTSRVCPAIFWDFLPIKEKGITRHPDLSFTFIKQERF